MSAALPSPSPAVSRAGNSARRGSLLRTGDRPAHSERMERSSGEPDRRQRRERRAKPENGSRTGGGELRRPKRPRRGEGPWWAPKQPTRGAPSPPSRGAPGRASPGPRRVDLRGATGKQASKQPEPLPASHFHHSGYAVRLRASPARGQGFESLCAHHPPPVKALRGLRTRLPPVHRGCHVELEPSSRARDTLRTCRARYRSSHRST